MNDHTTCPECSRAVRLPDGPVGCEAHCNACGARFVPGTVRNRTITLGLGGGPGASPPIDPDALPPSLGGQATLAAAGPGVALDPPPASGAVKSRSVAEIIHSSGDPGRYQVDTVIGRGGMGVVVRAVDRDLHRDVAIKLLARDGARERARFVAEAQITGQLEHPNIVPVHDLASDEGGRLFFAMKLVRGRSLSEVLELVETGGADAQEFSLGRLLSAFIGVCNAVAFAHARGVIHRDLKPSNVMLGGFGEVQVMDWGLARVRGAGATADAAPDQAFAERLGRMRTVSGAGGVEGTPEYMPPEQARGDVQAVDERSDIYSLGAILYEILTLRAPIEGTTLEEVLRNAAAHRILPPTLRAPDRGIPSELDAIAMKALAADPAQRYQRVEDLRRDIELYREDRTVSAKSDSAVESMAKLVRRNQGTATAIAVGVGLLAVVLTLTFNAIRRERDHARDAAQNARTEEAKAESALESLRAEQRTRAELQRTAAPALVAKARRAMERKAWSDAQADLELALSFDDQLADTRLLLSELRLREGDRAGAAAQLAIYLRLRPDDGDARRLADLIGDGRADSSTDATAIADALVRLGASTVAEDLFQVGRERIDIYRRRLEQAWPGSTRSGFGHDKDGRLSIEGLRGRADVDDLAPLSGMPIVRLRLGDTKVIDLAPLAGMPLASLELERTPVRDLAPLAGMPLASLNLAGTRVIDLAPLRGMPLAMIDISSTAVADLAPLAGCPLRALRAGGSQVASLFPLADAPLTEVDLTGTETADLTPLSGSRLSTVRIAATRIISLEPLRGMPLSHLAIENTRIADLRPVAGAPLRTIGLVGSDVADLTPLADTAITALDLSGLAVADLAPLVRLPLSSLILARTPTSTLAPLKGLRLTTLSISGTSVTDLSPLRGMPLGSLDLSDTPVADLAALEGMPLGSLALDRCQATDLKPLRRCPLKELRLAGLRLGSLAPLANLPLERVIVPAELDATALAPLQAIKGLRQIGTAWEGGWSRVPTAEAFWKKLERGR